MSAQVEALAPEGVATSAIEGEIFDPDALRSSLARKLGIPSARTATRSRKIDGLVEMLPDATRHLDQPLDLARLCAWQAALFPTGGPGLNEFRIGELRGRQPMRSVSRRLMAERDAYYAALEDLSRGGLDITPWLSWYVAQVKGAMDDSQRTVGHVTDKARFWLRHAGDDLNARQRKAINRMLDAGPDGFEGGMNNRKYASLSACSPATAQRDLAQLVLLGCLTAEGAGRSVRHQLQR